MHFLFFFCGFTSAFSLQPQKKNDGEQLAGVEVLKSRACRVL
jgi:hypothetical protein